MEIEDKQNIYLSKLFSMYDPGMFIMSEGRVKCPPLTCLQEHLELFVRMVTPWELYNTWNFLTLHCTDYHRSGSIPDIPDFSLSCLRDDAEE